MVRGKQQQVHSVPQDVVVNGQVYNKRLKRPVCQYVDLRVQQDIYEGRHQTLSKAERLHHRYESVRSFSGIVRVTEDPGQVRGQSRWRDGDDRNLVVIEDLSTDVSELNGDEYC